MRYYLDTERTGFAGTLFSMALVREDGESIYWVLDDYDKIPVVPWVAENVLPVLFECATQPVLLARSKLAMQIGRHLAGDDDPTIIADWPEDIRHFCDAVITGPGAMIRLPSFKFEVRRVEFWPTSLSGAVRHNAWWDAKALWHALELRRRQRIAGRNCKRLPSPDEVSAMCAAAQPQLELMIKFAVASGSRLSEQLAVRWGDIDTDAAILTIPERYGARRVPLPDVTIRDLQEWRAASAFSGRDDLVFGNRRGGALGPLSVHKSFSSLWIEVNRSRGGHRTDQPLIWHGLRMAAVQRWKWAGLSDQKVAEYAGSSYFKPDRPQDAVVPFQREGDR